MKKLPKPSEALKLAVKAYLIAKAYKETLAERIIPVQKAVLAELQISTVARKRAASEVIVEPAMVYLASKEDSTKYYTRMQDVYKEMGYDLEYGYCPLCMAENEQVRKEWQIFKNLEFINLTYDQANSLFGEKREKLLDLVCKAVVLVSPKAFFKLEVAA